jgi:hypothetical protein
MADVIAVTSRLVNDAGHAYHTAQQVQDALDRNRDEARYMHLTALPTVAAGGVTTYLTFAAPDGMTTWESDGELVDGNHAALTPETKDWMTGRWTFATAPARPVRLTGWSYDIYAAAADLLEIRASQVSEDVQSFSGQNGSFSFAAKNQAVLQMASRYRAMARVRVTDMVRTDTAVLL